MLDTGVTNLMSLQKQRDGKEAKFTSELQETGHFYSFYFKECKICLKLKKKNSGRKKFIRKKGARSDVQIFVLDISHF